jgi:hypothetical protein
MRDREAQRDAWWFAGLMVAVRKELSCWSSLGRMLRTAGPADELGMTIQHCVATPLGTGGVILWTNVIPFVLL